MKISELQARRAEMIEEARAILDKPEGGEEAIREYDAKIKEADELHGRITRLERQAELDAELERRQRATAAEPRESKEGFRSLGEWFVTSITNPDDPRLQEVRQANQSMGVGEQGGFLVPDEFSTDLLTVSPDEAIIRPRARVLPGQGDAQLSIPAIQYSGNSMYGGVEVNWIGEGDLKPQTDMQFKQVTLEPNEVAAHIRVTDKLLRNAPAMEQIINTQLREALIAAEEDTFLNGVAANQPSGIIPAAATIDVNRAVADQVAYDDLVDMFSVFRGRRGVWVINRGVLPQLMSMTDAGNNLVWQPNARDGNPGTIFGYPVLFSDHSPDLGDTGDLLLIDPSYYLIRDGIGVSIAASGHVGFTNNLTYIKAFKTVDGAPWLTGPLPTNPDSSPFIALEA